MNNKLINKVIDSVFAGIYMSNQINNQPEPTKTMSTNKICLGNFNILKKKLL